MTSSSLSAGSTLTTLGADMNVLPGCLADRFAGGVDDWGDLFFYDRGDSGDLMVGVCYFVVGLDGSGLFDLSFELLLFGLVPGSDDIHVAVGVGPLASAIVEYILIVSELNQQLFP